MQFNKPKFWETTNLRSYLLFPFSLLVLLIIYLKKKIVKSVHFDVPVICVGNIYVGGTGKTPTSIYLAKELSKIGKNPVILRKYYKEHYDEYALIKEKFNNLILNKNRRVGIFEALKKGYDGIILDDGFQDYKITKDFNIICFNQNQLLGNGFVIPAGPLREDLSAIKNAHLILINGKKDIHFEEKLFNINKNLKFFYSHYNPINISKFKGKKLLAIAGIGNPDNFFNLLIFNNLNLEKKLIFPDHYKFKEREIKEISTYADQNNYQIIMTEKDYFKIKQFNIKNLGYLKIELEIANKENLIKKIKEIYDKKN